MPPASITLLLPALSRSWASITAFIPEPHSLLMVVQPVAGGSPASSAAWRAGPCLRPAASTQPMITSSTSAGAMPARSIAARRAAAPSCGAVRADRLPWKPPIGVRAALTMTISDIGDSSLYWAFCCGALRATLHLGRQAASCRVGRGRRVACWR
ncbi:hypothetical protein D3C81_1009260 [compost metagenome]